MSEQHVDDALEGFKSLKSKFEDLTLHNETMKSSILELLTAIKERDKEIMTKVNTLQVDQNEFQEYNYKVKEFIHNQVRINKSHHGSISFNKSQLSNYTTKEDLLTENTLLKSRIETLESQVNNSTSKYKQEIETLINKVATHNIVHLNTIRTIEKLKFIFYCLTLIIMILSISLCFTLTI